MGNDAVCPPQVEFAVQVPLPLVQENVADPPGPEHVPVMGGPRLVTAQVYACAGVTAPETPIHSAAAAAAAMNLVTPCLEITCLM
jgi:hypothetical protein